ncbi:MAG: rhodanese-like domain-containing protein [Planctomycetota bacterium]
MQTIDIHQVAAIRGGSARIELIDVRTPAEFREAHAEGARNVPLDRLKPDQVFESTSSESIYLICKSGSRSQMAAKKFIQAGFDQVISVDGGTEAWVAAGLPVVRGKKTISLERQVRIVAGFLVLLGASLGFFLNPYFIGLAGFVGAGLMFAGITDTCGMGMMLAKMPWNQVATDACNR